MKANKFFMGALLIAGFAMALNTSCKPKEDPTPIVIPDDTTKTQDPEPVVEETPEVAAPGAGMVTLVINIPEGTECNGIAFKGTLDGAAWTGADQYLGLEGPAAPDACVKFEKVGDSKVWWKATYKVGTEAWGDNIFMAGKLCLIFSNDGSWEGQAINWEFVDDYSTVDHSTSDDGNIQVNGTTGLLYVKVGGWQGSECATPQQYTITFKTPAWCDGADANVELEVAGSMNSWGGGDPCTKVSDQEYKVTLTATPNAEYKIRSVGAWDVEIQELKEDGTWGGCSNNVLGEETTVVVDYTNAEKYRWNVCAPAEPEPAAE
jgi:hypothetical protein